MKPRSIPLFLVFAVTLASVARADEDGFFSHKRFFLNESVIKRVPSSNKMVADIGKFADDFTGATGDMSQGKFEDAREKLFLAREGWPEYFGVDFLIALTYEEEGDYKKAARYYKSYLEKLENLYEGRYFISSPLILSLSTSEIESYPEAFVLVKERLASHGVDFGRIRPVFTFPGFVLPVILFIAIGSFFVMCRRFAWPYLKKRRDIKHPPEGFWVCPACGVYNPDLAKECAKCRKMK